MATLVILSRVQKWESKDYVEEHGCIVGCFLLSNTTYFLKAKQHSRILPQEILVHLIIPGIEGWGPLTVCCGWHSLKKDISVVCYQLERCVCFSNIPSFIICGLASPPNVPVFIK